MNSEIFDLNVSTKRGCQPRVTRSTKKSVKPEPLDHRSDSKSPPRNSEVMEMPSTPTIKALKQMENTPRRSARKSIKPVQDYSEIISNHKLRANHSTSVGEESSDVNAQPKWTPAKVGRVSQKRSNRKSSRKVKTKKSSDEEEKDTHTGEYDLAKQGPRKVETEISSDDEKKSSDADDNHLADQESSNTDNIVKIIPKVSESLNTNLEIIGESANKDTLEKMNTTYDQVVEAEMKELLNETFEKSDEDVDGAVSNKLINVKQKISIKTGEIDLLEMGVTPIVYDNEECVDDDPNKLVEQNQNSTFEADKKEKKNVEIEERQQVEIFDENSLGCTPLESSKIAEIEICESDMQEIQSNAEKAGNDLLSGTEAEETSLDFLPITADDDDEVFPSSETKDGQQQIDEKKVEAEDEEMPSLIFCDEDEEDDEDEKESIVNKKSMNEKRKSVNESFNSSDCMIISPAEQIGTKKLKLEQSQPGPSPTFLEAMKNVKKLQNEYFSPVKNLKKVVPKVVLSNEDNVKEEILVSTPRKGIQTFGGKTPTSNKKKPTSKGYRFPTPFKSKKEFDFGKKDEENNDDAVDLPVPCLTTLEPKDIVLRSIRKRSKSVTIEGNKQKRKLQNVTFHSPANQTATIADLDKLIMKSTAKSAKKDQPNQVRGTPQRKRSLSMDERFLRHPSKLPKRVHTPSKIQPTTQKPTASRVKMPNFAAIHQKQYQQMENVVDYVARKAERAQNLTNSALKARNAAMPPKSPLPKLKNPAVAKPMPFVFAQENAPHKASERKQRHMEMFKSRSVDPKRVTHKNNEIIRGVRSNRRFELMMQHRKTSGN